MYGYGVWSKVAMRLNIDLASNSLRNLQKYNQVKQQMAKGNLTKENMLFFLRFSEGDQRLQDKLHSEGYKLFPNPEFSQFIRNREEYLPEIDGMTKYPLKRVYLPAFSSSIYDVIRDNFGEQPVVVKVGNLHASEAKWLVRGQGDLPRLKYALRQLPITIEEFVPDARSIRIGFIGDATDFSNYFITEHVNSKTWLKNNAPEEELTYSHSERYTLGIGNIDELFDEAKVIALKYGADLLGVDWVISENKTGLLELNDMIGLPDGDYAFELFLRRVKTILENNTNEGGSNERNV